MTNEPNDDPELRAVRLHRMEFLRWIPRLWMPLACANVSGSLGPEVPAFGTILWSPQKLPAGSSEFVGGTFKVSSGKFVGSFGDLCGNHEKGHRTKWANFVVYQGIACVCDHFVVPAKVAGWVERVCWKNF